MKKQAIIVEDCLIQSTVLKKILENEGFEISGIYSSGPEAIEGGIQHKPSILLIDIFLKGNLNGFEVARKVRELYDVPVIFITAVNDKDQCIQNHNFEKSILLNKPVSRTDLLDSIHFLLNPVHA